MERVSAAITTQVTFSINGLKKKRIEVVYVQLSQNYEKLSVCLSAPTGYEARGKYGSLRK